jgi:hypothetical protein
LVWWKKTDLTPQPKTKGCKGNPYHFFYTGNDIFLCIIIDVNQLIWVCLFREARKRDVRLGLKREMVADVAGVTGSIDVQFIA